MSRNMHTLQEKVNFLREIPQVFDIVSAHCGVNDLSNLNGISANAFERVKRYVDYYYGIIANPY